MLAPLSISMVKASSYVMGRIYLNNGTVIECTQRDRIKLPKRSNSVVFLCNAYSKDEIRKKFPASQVDSIIAWHPATPEHIRKFVSSDNLGWLWIYFETPQICASIYSSKGYGIDTNGGIQVLQKKGLVFHSKTTYCLKKTGVEDFEPVGATKSRSNKKFRKKVAEYIWEDPNLSNQILNSNARRNKIILMLLNYNPTNNATP